MFGRLFADKGYIAKALFQRLFERNSTLVTKVRKDMKNRLMLLSDRLLLRKRAIIESVNDFLKNTCQIEHTRHRCVTNVFVNLIAGISAYSFISKKPSLHLSRGLSCSLTRRTHVNVNLLLFHKRQKYISKEYRLYLRLLYIACFLDIIHHSLGLKFSGGGMSETASLS